MWYSSKKEIKESFILNHEKMHVKVIKNYNVEVDEENILSFELVVVGEKFEKYTFLSLEDLNKKLLELGLPSFNI
ncbi:hypothetical protein [Muninn virus]|nr:hypothetical protein [Muninn virus]